MRKFRFIPLRVRAMALVALSLTVMSVLERGAFAAADGEDDDTSPVEKAAARLPQPVVSGTLIHRKVLEPLESQPVLGQVTAIVRSGDGAIKVVIAYGGFLGFGGRPIAVPVEAMTLLGEYMEIVDFTPDQLSAFPSFDVAAATALPASETIQVGLAKPPH